MGLNKFPNYITRMCVNVTPEMRAFCLKHLEYAYWPEEWARGVQGIETATEPFTEQFLWEMLNDTILHEAAPHAVN